MKLTKLSRLAISDEGFVFDPLTGTSYTINHSAKKILQQLIAGSSEEEAALTLVKDFDLSEQAAERDLQDFLRQLRILELI
jgi:PqqD family protein of HPr-rel-A system